MKTVATTKIECPNTNRGRHEVSLMSDGSIVCACSDGVAAGSAYAGRLMLGMPPISGVRGCAVLAAVAQSAAVILPKLRSVPRIDDGVSFLGGWHESVVAYQKNPVFLAAIAQAEAAQPERKQIHKTILAAAERAGYRHALGKRRFAQEFRTYWDTPIGQLDRFPVSSFDDDAWGVPYMPGWLDAVGERQAIVDGKVVCAIDDGFVYAITRNEDFGGNMHWIRRFKRSGAKLRLVE